MYSCIVNCQQWRNEFILGFQTGYIISHEPDFPATAYKVSTGQYGSVKNNLLQLIPCSTCIPYNLPLGEPAVEPGAAPPGDLEPRAHPPGQVHLHRLPAKVHQHYLIYMHPEGQSTEYII